jgi:ankyrin repeat protein
MKKLINILYISLLVCAQAHAMDNQEQLNKSLLEAAKAGNLEHLKQLIEAKADVNSTGEYGNSTLVLAIRNNHLPCVEALIAAKADVNLKNENRYTPLTQAVMCKKLSCVQALIAANVHINQPDPFGHTPLKEAARNGSQSICEALAEALLCLPNAEQQEKIVILLGLNKCRNELNSLGFGKNFASAFKPYLRAALYNQNRQNFQNSIAYQEINKLHSSSLSLSGPIKKHLLEKYSNKPDAAHENKSN